MMEAVLFLLSASIGHGSDRQPLILRNQGLFDAAICGRASVNERFEDERFEDGRAAWTGDSWMGGRRGRASVDGRFVDGRAWTDERGRASVDERFEEGECAFGVAELSEFGRASKPAFIQVFSVAPTHPMKNLQICRQIQSISQKWGLKAKITAYLQEFRPKGATTALKDVYLQVL
ncbi:hypothetical protein ACFSR7_30040 [Cohnella sp. GCM10020058]|uniref:hypothetical protein n=1 Tax=Cohnella sp. GCM10020058 TaxID=3317330 RepID=UPI00362C21FF